MPTTRATIELGPLEAPPSPVPPERFAEMGLVGRGGMGEVWRVHDRVLDRNFVRKELRADRVNDATERARFLNEARITAQLRHPGVVPVYDILELPDGRPAYTMAEVRGSRLSELLHGVLRVDRVASLRRFVDVVRRVCEVAALAHARGILHRDIKSENVMVGDFDAVFLLDWGIARAAPPERDAWAGHIVGTPGLMAPEMEAGTPGRVGPPSDVFQLGALLWEVLAAAPFARERPPLPPGADPALVRICETALAPAPGDRFPSAAPLAAALGDWLDGMDRRDRALVLVADAARQAALGARHLAEEERLRAEADRILDPLQSYDDAALKRPGWALLDAARAEAGMAALAEERQEQALQSALRLFPALREADDALADLIQRRMAAAEAGPAGDASERLAERLRLHDHGRYADWLRGEGRLSLVTDPPGARARLFRFEERDRRLEPQLVAELGPTPLRELRLPRGSYLVELEAPGCVTVRYPVRIERQVHWDGVAPGDVAPRPVRLPRVGELTAEEVYVPPGWTTFGGDPEAGDGLGARRVWVEGFAIGVHPVTLADYRDFLNDLAAGAGPEVAARHLPRNDMRRPGQEADLLVQQGDRFGLDPGAPPDAARLPVVSITWWDARAYCAWRARTLPGARLPHSVEWEKAARGVDRRSLPWGEHLEPTWACIVSSRRTPPTVSPVDEWPLDLSPYGVRGLVGNVRDLCAEVYTRSGPGFPRDRLVLEDDDRAGLWRSARGGSVLNAASLVRPCTRFALHPEARAHVVGFRVARSL